MDDQESQPQQPQPQPGSSEPQQPAAQPWQQPRPQAQFQPQQQPWQAAQTQDDQPVVSPQPQASFNSRNPQPTEVTREPFASTPMTPGGTAPQKGRKKRLIIIGSIVAGLLVLIGGSALAYNVWYQNPQKVVTDGIIHAVEAKSATYKGTLDLTGDTKVKVAVDGGYASGAGDINATITFDIAGTTYNLGTSGLIDNKNDLYFKVKNIDQLVKTYRDEIPTSAQPTFDQIVAKINDKWIKISADELKTYSEDASKAQTCTTDAIKKFQDDKQANAEIGDIYKKHQFIKIDKKLGSKDGSLGYSLSSDDTAAKAFVLDFKNTQLYKNLHNCDSSFTIDEKDLTKASDTNSDAPNVELWVSRWSHQITKLVVTDKPGSTASTKGTLIIEPVFNAPVTITTPKDATTLKDLTTDIQKLFESAYGSDTSTMNGSAL